MGVIMIKFEARLGLCSFINISTSILMFYSKQKSKISARCEECKKNFGVVNIISSE